MLSTCITNINVKPAQVGDVLRKAELDLLPRYRDLPGFVAFTVAKTGDTSAISLSIWQTHEQAEMCIRSNETWLRESARQEIGSMQSHVGDLPFLAFTGDLKVYASMAPVGSRPV
jgi:hypothetical protein